MSKKNIFLLAAGYIAWWLIASLYSKKNPLELKKEMEESKNQWEWEFKVILNNFIETHENLLNELKNQISTDKNKDLYNQKKEELLKIIDSYKVQWMELLEELKIKWKDFISEASVKLEKLYDEKRIEIESLKDIAPWKIQEIKDNLKSTFDELKSKIK
jgi:hypothetical protein